MGKGATQSRVELQRRLAGLLSWMVLHRLNFPLVRYHLERALVLVGLQVDRDILDDRQHGGNR